MRSIGTVFFVCLACALRAQFAPAAGEPSSTAIFKDSNVFISWAKSCTVELGPRQINYPDSGKAAVGIPEYATSYSDPRVISLGDGGTATLTFDPPIVDGPGFDFAVFENGFEIQQGHDSDFLEFAFVEVSSDGMNFYRFPAESLIDTTRQQDTYDGCKAWQVHNLAGKYVARYGTPFDLNELSGIPGLNLQSVSHVRVIDVVGTMIDSLASRDSKGRKINDPWPTLFPQSGFDLEAIGVIHNQHAPNGISEWLHDIRLFPNPQVSGKDLRVEGLGKANYRVISENGMLVSHGKLDAGGKLPGASLTPGYYIVMIESEFGMIRKKLVIVP